MKFNKIVIVILLACFLILFGNNLECQASENIENDQEYFNSTSSTNKSGDYEYLVVSNGIYIISYSGTAQELTIPAYMEGYKVTGLYSECFASAPNLKKVNIPETVNSIYADTFINCRKLEAIEVSSKNSTYTSVDGMLYSKDYVYFVTCPEGKKGAVSIKNGAQYICDNSFFNASKVTSIYIPASVFDIGAMAFFETSSLSSFTVDSSNKSFVYSDGILYNNSKTEVIKCVDTRRISVNIASTVRNIRDYAFYNCKSLLGPLQLPNSLEVIGESAFFNCNSLTGKITIPSNLSSIGNGAFYSCFNITSLEIPMGLLVIPDDCFAYCTSLKEIKIPNSVKQIGERAFFYCTGVEKLDLGLGVTSINNWAFDYMTSLKGDIVLPDSLIILGDSVFQHSPNVDGYIVIGSNVAQIGASIFYESENAKGIVFRGSVPAVSNYAFIKPDVPYYHLNNKLGFNDILKNKNVYPYVENPKVTFVANDNEYKVVDLKKYGQTVEEFEAPIEEGYSFEGWYYDEEYTKRYSFSDVIMNNTTLYAKFEVINNIEFKLDNLLLEIDGTYKISYEYTLEPDATIEDIVWQSADSDIATVDSEGNITGIAKGTTKITATYKNAYAELYVTVFKEENEITFSDDVVRIVIGNERMLDINYHLLNGALYEDIVWSSSDESIATVENGKVTAIAEGTVTITASYEDVEDEIEVQVVRKNELDITTPDILIKEEKTSSIEVEYYFNDEATLNDIVWSSSNPNVVSVSDGNITAISAGEATITASYADVHDSIKITVVGKDRFNFKNDTLNIENTNNTFDLEYDFYSYENTKDDILWDSSNTKVATIQNGTLNIIANGQTIITALVGEAIDTIIINVVDESRLEFSSDTMIVEYRRNNSAELDLDYYFNDGGTLEDIRFESSNTNVLRIVNNHVIPIGIGKATVTATYKNLSDTLEVEVKSVEKLSFKQVGYIIGIGKTQMIEYIFDSYDKDYQNITFTSLDPDIARIQNGKIIGVGFGETTIRANYKNLTAEIKVIVAENSYMLGDMDGNGVITANDASTLLDLYKNGNISETQKIIGDMDGNGSLTANDASIILDIYKNGK